MQLRQSYDLIVIGDQVGGYLIANSAAMTGHRVLVIEGKNSSNKELSSIYENTEILTWEPVIGLDSNSELDQYLQNNNVYLDLENEFPSIEPDIQILTNADRIDFYFDTQKANKEAELLFGVEKTKILALSSSIAQGNLNVNVQLNSEKAMECKHFFNASATLFGSVFINENSSRLSNITRENASKSVRLMSGGRQRIKRRLQENLLAHKGHIKLDTWVEEIVFEHSKPSGVLLSTFEGFVGAKLIIGSMGARRFSELIPRKYRNNILSNEINRLQPIYSRFNFLIKTDKNKVPEGLAQHACILNANYPISDSGFIQILSSSNTRAIGQAIGTDGDKVIFLVKILLPYTQSYLHPDKVSIAMKRAIKVIQTFIPSVMDESTQVLPDPNNLPNDPLYKSFLGISELDKINPHQLIFSSSAADGNLLGIEPLWKKFGLDGLALCSCESLPTLGFTGEVLTAIKLSNNMKKLFIH